MTCEVVVMNKRGVALAADSAVTLSPQNKIYHTAEKLFQISPDLPVAIMTYGSADLMDIPWETLIKTYARRFAGNRFETLEQHADNFVSYIAQQRILLEPERQDQYVSYSVRDLLGYYREKFIETSQEPPLRLSDIVKSHVGELGKFPKSEHLGSDFGKRTAEKYAAMIDEAVGEVFENIKLTSSDRRELRSAAEAMFATVFPEDSGVVIAGMGEEDLVPVLVEYGVSGVALDKLRYARKSEPTRITPEMDACVAPYAQDAIIRQIIGGIHEDLREVIESVLPGGQKRGKFEAASEKFADKFTAAVAALPTHDLAKMAESLVSLTAFVKRMRVDEDETVAEPVDVAILSKGDGFRWFRHKDIMQEDASRLSYALRPNMKTAYTI
jgi:hypothetical protein